MTFHTVQDKLHQNLREIVCHEIDIVLDEDNEWLIDTIKKIIIKAMREIDNENNN
jgi:hypothetical protein